jgi:hypothetical protein
MLLVRYCIRFTSRLFSISLLLISAYLVSCQKEDDPSLATITTSDPSTIGSTFAIGGGNVFSDGGVPITDKGIVWSTNPNPTIDLPTKTTSNSVSGSFTGNITPLSISTKYYLRAYATNPVGTAYGNEISFTTASSGPCMIERYTDPKYSYYPDGGFLYKYDGNKKLDMLEEQDLDGTTWKSTVFYKYRYTSDSIYINYFLNGAVKNLIFTVASSGGKILAIKRYFIETGGVNRFSFDYSVANQVTITMDYLANNVTQLKRKGIYRFDAKGNVTQLETYIYENDPPTLTTTVFSYDQSENPLKGLIPPFYITHGLPPAAYLSASNVVSELTNGVTTNYAWQYGVNGLPGETIVISGSGSPKTFSYINCPF